MKKRHLSKTNWYGMLILSLGFLQTEFPRLEAVLGENAGVVYIGIGLSIIILRELTTERVG